MPDYSMLCAAASGEEYVANIIAKKFNNLNISDSAQPVSAGAAPKGPDKDFGL